MSFSVLSVYVMLKIFVYEASQISLQPLECPIIIIETSSLLSVFSGLNLNLKRVITQKQTNKGIWKDSIKETHITQKYFEFSDKRKYHVEMSLTNYAVNLVAE
jgi:hypothetical protein